jgi:hypothetical protein
MAGLLSYVLLGFGFLLMAVGIFLYALYFPEGVPFWVWIIIAVAFLLIVVGLITNITSTVITDGYDSSGYPYGYNFYYKRPATPNDPFTMNSDSYIAGPMAVTNVEE